LQAEPGYQTTEFWGKMFVQLLALLTLFHLVHFTSDQLQAVLGFGGLVVPEVFYAISRGIRKAPTTSPSTVAVVAVQPVKPAA
jgi:hypothetical protein